MSSSSDSSSSSSGSETKEEIVEFSAIVPSNENLQCFLFLFFCFFFFILPYLQHNTIQYLLTSYTIFRLQ